MGEDKAFLDWHGSPLWIHQINKLLLLKPERTFIAARRDQAFHIHLDTAIRTQRVRHAVEMVEDPVGEDCGPMGALIRCLKISASPLLALAVDMPHMDIERLTTLLRLAKPGRGCVWTGPQGHEVLAALYVPEMLPLMQAAFLQGSFSLQKIVSAAAAADVCDLHEIAVEDAVFFTNVNTPEEADRILRFKA